MFDLKFDTSSAAFDADDGAAEAARILRDLAERVLKGDRSGHVFDVNGNRIGRWSAATLYPPEVG